MLSLSHLVLLLLLLASPVFSSTLPRFPHLSDVDSQLQIRLSMMSPSVVSVQWTTMTAIPTPLVMYGLASNALTLRSTGPEQSTYDNIHWFNHADLPELQPATQYFYQLVNSTDSTPYSSVHSFTSPPAPGIKSFPVTVGVVGDLGTDYDATAPAPESVLRALNGSKNAASMTMLMMMELMPSTDFYWHVGDLSYADDYWYWPDGSRSYEQTWNMWQQLMSPLTSQKIYQTMPGNHEVSCREDDDSLCPANQKNFTAYLNRFNMPGGHGFNGDSFRNMWFSYDYGGVHFISLNSETDYPDAPSGPGTKLNNPNLRGLASQLEWLEQDLIRANANRANVPWIIAGSHRPFYGSTPGNSPAAQAAFEPLFIKYGVDLYMSGHVHAYERMYPVGLNGSLPNGKSYENPTVPVYLINGCGGSVEGLTRYAATPQPYSAVYLPIFGMGQMNFIDAEHFEWTYYSSFNGSAIDSFKLYKKRDFLDRIAIQ